MKRRAFTLAMWIFTAFCAGCAGYLLWVAAHSSDLPPCDDAAMFYKQGTHYECRHGDPTNEH